MSYGQVNADVIGTSVAGSNLGAGDASLMKSRIINGAMVIDQRNAGASGTSTGYTVDRWQYLATQASKGTWQQNAGSVTAPVGFTNYLGFTSSSAYSVGATDYFYINQNIEGYNWADLNWGTANAKTVTLSAWVRSSLTGTFGGSLLNWAGNYSYPFTYSIPVANTWTQISVTIAGPTAGTWAGATNAGALQVYFSLGTGSTYSGTAGSWSANYYGSATGATSVVGTSGATFYITGVQLEVGSSATGYEYRQYTTELQLCQRYLPSFYIGGGQNSAMGTNYSSGNFITSMVLPVQARTPPTGIVYQGTISNTRVYYNGTSQAANGISWNGGTYSTVSFNITSAATTAGQGAIWAAESTYYVLYFTGSEL